MFRTCTVYGLLRDYPTRTWRNIIGGSGGGTPSDPETPTTPSCPGRSCPQVCESLPRCLIEIGIKGIYTKIVGIRNISLV